MKTKKKPRLKTETEDDLPYPDSGWLPGLQRTIKRKLENGEIDEVDAEVFRGMMGIIADEKSDENSSKNAEKE